MVDVVKKAIKTQNTNHVIFPGLSMEKKIPKACKKKRTKIYYTSENKEY